MTRSDPRKVELHSGDKELCVEFWDDGTVSLGIDNRFGGPYNEGSSEYIELTPEQAQELWSA